MATYDCSLTGIECWLKLQSNLKEDGKIDNKEAKTHCCPPAPVLGFLGC